MEYTIPEGLYAVPEHLLDLRSDAEIDHDLLNPRPVTDEKNVWFFWHQGFSKMHPYTQRNIRAWHRRFSKQGWAIRVVDLQPSSPLNVANFLDVQDPNTFPQAFINRTLGGHYGLQHTSDLVRWPLLLAHGGVYADVGMLQIGDLDRTWTATVGNPSSPIEVLSYDGGSTTERTLTNYFLASGRNNPLFARCHKLLLHLWATDGGKTSTDGMHASPLVRAVPLMGDPSLRYTGDDGAVVTGVAFQQLLTDYIIQGQVMTLVMGLEDAADGWDGPQYVVDHVYAMEFLNGAQLVNVLTAWDGRRAFELMSLPLPQVGAEENEDQWQARGIVEACLQKSFGFKLAHGLIIRTLGETLGSLWRAHEGSDDVPGTYAHWLRYGIANWNQKDLPPRVEFPVKEPLKRGPLLG